MHFLTEPTHWVPFVVAVALAVGGIVLLRGRRTRRAVVIDDDRGKYL